MEARSLQRECVGVPRPRVKMAQAPCSDGSWPQGVPGLRKGPHKASWWGWGLVRGKYIPRAAISPHCSRDAWDHPRRRSSGEQGLCSSSRRSRAKIYQPRVCMDPVSPHLCWEQAAASKQEPCSPRSSSARAGVQQPKPSHLRGVSGWPAQDTAPQTCPKQGSVQVLWQEPSRSPWWEQAPLSPALIRSSGCWGGRDGASLRAKAPSWCLGTGKEAERDLPAGQGGEEEQEHPALGMNTPWQTEHHPRRLCHQPGQEPAAALAMTTGDSSTSLTVPDITENYTFSRRTQRPWFKTSSERLAGREGAGYIPRCSVILCPDPDKLIQMVRAQDGGVSCQVLKVVHDDCHKQVEHLNQRGKRQGERKVRGEGAEKGRGRVGGKWGRGSRERKRRKSDCGKVMEDDLMADKGDSQSPQRRQTHQEGAEEDEGHEVNVGQVGAAALVLVLPGRGRGVRLAALALQAGQHDLLPRLSSGTPVPNTALSAAPAGTGLS